ncbi:MAG: Lrp/AsnC family transcriptional regulator [Verrucomicrobiae bacterium]|nr:Lrp/AsnC family transcriptional regulator [Verrucomicrobiae bacterium]MCP5541717.1 Lrp/AsnC family transcriptional regulator [Akkermansiaceae bacterium]MCP5551756.1 Lrp/AsnC family transcriptional regulator [Akkermansiaceae bacterium]
MEALLELLQQNARLGPAQLAERLGQDEAVVAARVAELEKEKVILGYHGVIDRDKAGNHNVAAFIEVKLMPERGGGFDRLAQRIAKFDQVTSCFLMSGGYDLAVFVEGEDLREVARFVAERLSTIEGVQSTATHFQLKVYKQNGFLAEVEAEATRLPVAP